MTKLFKVYLRINFIFKGLVKIKSSILKKQYFKDVVFVVYSSGHNGSTTIYYNLLKRFPFVKVFHVHLLSEYWLKKGKVKQNDRNEVLRKRVLNYILKNPNKKYYFITLIREPISRSISSYFYNNNVLYSKKNEEIIENIIEENDMEKNVFWFEKDFNDYFNTNYLNHSFDKKQGYGINSFSENVKCLLLRTDRMNKSFSDAFLKLTGYQIKSLTAFNKREKTKASVIYKEVRSSFRLEMGLLDYYLSSDFVKKFFTKDEINELKKKHKK